MPRAVAGAGAPKTEGAGAPNVLCGAVVVLPNVPNPLVGCCCVEDANEVPNKPDESGGGALPNKPVVGAAAPKGLVAGAGAGAPNPPNPVGAGAGAPKVLPNAGAPKVAGAGAPKPPVDGAAPKPTVPNVDGAGAPKGDAAGGDAKGLVFCCPNMLVLTRLCTIMR